MYVCMYMYIHTYIYTHIYLCKTWEVDNGVWECFVDYSTVQITTGLLSSVDLMPKENTE